MVCCARRNLDAGCVALDFVLFLISVALGGELARHLLFFGEVGHGMERQRARLTRSRKWAGVSHVAVAWPVPVKSDQRLLPVLPQNRPRKTCPPPKHTLTYSLLIVGKCVSAQSHHKALKNDSGVSSMSHGIGPNASRPLPDTLRTRSSTLLPFKSSGYMRTMILFGPAFRNPYLSQNSSTGA